MPGDSEVLGDLLARVSDSLSGSGHTDGAARVDAARTRLARPATVVCVVGEFKQGKSSLVNALIGREVCPVDDDIATSVITVVRHAENPSAVVRGRRDGEQTAHRIDLDEFTAHVTAAHSDDDLVVDRVEIGVPSALLADGLALVDTPGMGGVGAGHAAATLAFLPFADGLIFVTDASQELTAAEIGFLRTARELCPAVMVAITKTDITPHWTRIVDINRRRIEELGLDLAMVPVSSTLRTEALATRDRPLNDRSGYPELIEQLGTRVLQPAVADADARAHRETVGVLDGVITAATAELKALDSPEAREALARDAADATARLEQLRGPGARWNVVLGDRVTDLSNDATHGFRRGDSSLHVGDRRTHRDHHQGNPVGRPRQATAGIGRRCRHRCVHDRRARSPPAPRRSRCAARSRPGDHARAPAQHRADRRPRDVERP